MAIPEIGVLATTGVVGAGLPLAVGAGLAARRLGTGSVVLCFFGDGALAQGTFHESLNLATLWRLPVIFLCEVNQYAEMSPTSLHLSSPGVANRAAGYGCTGLKVDGNDVEAVRDATTEAAALCRAGRGPVLLEAQTYLLTGHYEGASLSYRPRDEVAAAEEREPLRTYRRALLAEGVDEAAIAACDRAVSEEVARAVRFALASPLPGHEDLAKGVWAE